MKSIFTLFSTVFLWWNNTEILFYNTESYKSLLIPQSPYLKDFCIKMSNIDFLYSISIDSKNNALSQFLETLVRDGFGVIHGIDEEIVSLPPILNLRNAWKKIKSSNAESTTEVLRYLSEVTIYLGGKHNGSEEYYKQTEYPISSEKVMDYDTLSKFLYKLRHCYLRRINFVFSDISNYPEFKKILSLISSFGNIAHCFFLYNSFGIGTINELIHERKTRVVLLHEPLGYKYSLADAQQCLHRILITNSECFVCWQDNIRKSGKKQFEFIPISEIGNEQFIAECLFPTKEELLNGKYSKRNIYIHQSINTFSFGKLYVLPDGSVYSNLLEPAVGSVESCIHDLIISEMNANYSWLRTRRYKGCGNCVFVDICPSPSVYERFVPTGCICRDIV